MKTIAIVVLNWQTPELTVNTVNSILKTSSSPRFRFRLLVVDNGSADNSLEIFKSKYSGNPRVEIISTGKNLGYVDGNNFGIRHSLTGNYDYSLIINSDVLVDPDFLLQLFTVAESDPAMAITGPKIYFAPGYEYQKDIYKKSELGRVIWSAGGTIDWNNLYGSNLGIDEVDHGQFNQINSDVDYLSGCCLLIKNNVFAKIGLFDSRYFMYSEDVEFCRRCLGAGYRLAYVPGSVIWHLNSGSSGRGAIHDYFLNRNRLLFGFKYSPSIRTKFALFRDSLRILLTSPYPWQRRGVLDYYLRRLGKGSWQ